MGFLGGVESSEQDMMKQFTSNTSFMASTNISTINNNSINNNNNYNYNYNQNSTLDEVEFDHHHHHHQQQQQQHHHHHQENVSFNMMQSSTPFMGEENNNNKEINTNNSNTTGAYDLGELDQALFLYLDGQTDQEPHHHSSSSSPGEGGIMRPPTLNIFPSQPMHIEPPSKASGSKRASEQPPTMELSNKTNNNINKFKNQMEAPAEQSKSIKREGMRKGHTSSSEQERPKTPDPKTLRRLAQNREAARKSRLRKKAYVQQLESSRIRLAQLEQELHRARAQGMFLGGGSGGGDQGIAIGGTNISSDAAMFDMEYTRWVEEHHRLCCELRAAVQEHVAENELKMYVENCLAHYDMVMNLKSMLAKTDVFHLVSGMWKTPAERCFLWLGDFRPSELIKVIVHQVEPLGEQQVMNICGLQQTTHEAEEALSQGLQLLHQSLSDVIVSDTLTCPPNMTNYMAQMALAINKLSTMENFVRQADSLRHQTLHRLHQILTTRQAARCFLAIAEYSHRLRALSSLWMTTPRQE
ncbi:hypothetical protein RND81_05G164200 [Saponaria officinalis]|uniref:Uncharacterized protein n=1 Tax=Saponaria officinalis TaxID=3572 RepID=A0AAW1KYP6_SAPOF